MAVQKAGPQDRAVTDDEIKLVIGSSEKWLNDLSCEIDSLRREYGRLEETIYSYVAWENSCLPAEGRGQKEDGAVLRTVLRKERELRRCRKELLDSLSRLEEERIRVQRVYLAYTALPRREYQVLKELYENRVTWVELPLLLGMSKRRICRLRAEAFAQIRRSVSPGEEEESVAESGWEYGEEEEKDTCNPGRLPYN